MRVRMRVRLHMCVFVCVLVCVYAFVYALCGHSAFVKQGYAFINFICPDAVEEFTSMWRSADG